MDGKGNIILDFVDVYGDRPDDRADVSLKHSVLSHSVDVKEISTSKRLRIQDLECAAGGRYTLQVFPLRHRPVVQFLTVVEGKTAQQTIVLPVNAERVVGIEAPNYDLLGEEIKRALQESRVEGNEDNRGESLYESLDDARKAGLLNIYAKMKATTFQNGRDSFSYISSFTRIRADTLFANVQSELRDEVINSKASRLFHEVSGVLHPPPPGFQRLETFATEDSYCNLQVTFLRKPDTAELMSELQIDAAQGITHVFQVLRTTITPNSTNPYDIHEILLQFQKIDPEYRLRLVT